VAFTQAIERLLKVKLLLSRHCKRSERERGEEEREREREREENGAKTVSISLSLSLSFGRNVFFFQS
jgi:hypothetical protein